VEARYKSAQAVVSEAATLKGYTVVKAPAAGVVAERKTAVGDVAQPGQALASLYDPDRLQIEGEVNDNYRDLVKIGEAAQVSVPAVKFEASLPIAEIFPISAPGSRTFKVRTGWLQNPGLVPGMFAHLSLPLGHSRGILIPQAAVDTVGQLTMVRVAADQTAQLRQVKLGRQIGGQVEVLAGLKAGDRIMVTGE
jgi:RND family efflux transporter MFP subunit